MFNNGNAYGFKYLIQTVTVLDLYIKVSQSKAQVSAFSFSREQKLKVLFKQSTLQSTLQVLTNLDRETFCVQPCFEDMFLRYEAEQNRFSQVM